MSDQEKDRPVPVNKREPSLTVQAMARLQAANLWMQDGFIQDIIHEARHHEPSVGIYGADTDEQLANALRVSFQEEVRRLELALMRDLDDA